MTDLKEKFQKWFEPTRLQIISPMRAASVVSAFQEKIRNEWINDRPREDIISDAFNELFKSLYSVRCFQLTGLPYSSQALRKMGKAYQGLSLDDKRQLADIKQGAQFVNPRVSEIYKDLSQYDYRNINNFIDLAKKQAKGFDVSLSDLCNAIESILLYGVFPKELKIHILHVYSQLQGHLNSVGYTASIEKIKNTMSPVDGPRSASEMLFCCYGFLNSGAFADANTNKYKAFMSINFMQFIGSVSDEFEDMPKDKMQTILDSGIKIFNEVLETHRLNMGHMIGLMRFFVHHHEGKIDLEVQAYREVLINKLYENMLLDQIANFKWNYQDADLGVLAMNLEWAEQFFLQYHKPDIDAVVEEIVSNILSNKPDIKGKRLVEEFLKARDAKPSQMEEVVVLYYPENEELRSMRQSFFKYSKLNGEDGPKISFLKFIAETQAEQLKAIGLDSAAIEFMATTGKIPWRSENEQYPLTLDHINDREFGGTNQHDNLVLLPREINEQKNRLKTLQLSSLTYKNQGCWIVNWVPKREVDGSYPLILQANMP